MTCKYKNFFTFFTIAVKNSLKNVADQLKSVSLSTIYRQKNHFHKVKPNAKTGFTTRHKNSDAPSG